MPLYEYECRQCRRRTEKIQKFSDPELTVCPYCSGVLERTLTAPAVHFAGGGWYKDLYSSAKPPAASSNTDNGSSGTPSGGTGDAAGSGSAPTTAEKPAAAAAPASTPAPAAGKS